MDPNAKSSKSSRPGILHYCLVNSVTVRSYIWNRIKCPACGHEIISAPRFLCRPILQRGIAWKICSKYSTIVLQLNVSPALQILDLCCIEPVKLKLRGKNYVLLIFCKFCIVPRGHLTTALISYIRMKSQERVGFWALGTTPRRVVIWDGFSFDLYFPYGPLKFS